MNLARVATQDVGVGYDVTFDALQRIVDRCAADDDRTGYFAAIYVAVTKSIRERAAAGGFQDPARIERFVGAFADRYLAADAAFTAGRATSESWHVAFSTAARWRPVILQHLLLGMNAHINLDLGVTTSTMGDDHGLEAVRADFDAINDVLGSLVDECQASLGEVSPWIGLCDRVGGSGDETLIRFSLAAARRQAWSVAQRLAPLDGAEREAAIGACDRAAARVGRRVAHPGPWASTVLLLVRARERARLRDVIALLAAIQG